MPHGKYLYPPSAPLIFGPKQLDLIFKHHFLARGSLIGVLGSVSPALSCFWPSAEFFPPLAIWKGSFCAFLAFLSFLPPVFSRVYEPETSSPPPRPMNTFFTLPKPLPPPSPSPTPGQLWPIHRPELLAIIARDECYTPPPRPGFAPSHV